MNISMNLYLPRFAELLGITPGVIYERMRVLAKAGVLRAEPGRGPGSGVRLSAEGIAMLLIAILGTDSIADTVAITLGLASAESDDWPVGDGKTFKDAIVQIILNPELSSKIYEIEVSRSRENGIIRGRFSAKADFHPDEPDDVVIFESMLSTYEKKYNITATLGYENLKSLLASAREALALASA